MALRIAAAMMPAAPRRSARQGRTPGACAAGAAARSAVGLTVDQLQTFLQHARHDRFFGLWVLETTSGMRRYELAGAQRDLLDIQSGTLGIEITRVVVDGKVIESDGKTANAQHLQLVVGRRNRGTRHRLGSSSHHRMAVRERVAAVAD
jgi:hypothetical protein